MSKLIGISSGDITGIGPEVLLKALELELAQDECRYLIFGDLAHLQSLREKLRLSVPLEGWTAESTARVQVTSSWSGPLDSELEPGSPAASQAAIAWLREGAVRCLKQTVGALVTAPVNKHAIIRSGQAFIGQTEFLAQLAGTERYAMMLLGHDDRKRWLRVALATTHVPIKIVSSNLEERRICETIELAAEACSRLGLSRARVGVCGLNPHAGEGGALGTEEEAVIIPAIMAAQSHGFVVDGPVSADTLFYRAIQGEYDAVVAMYHDQGLAPLKMVAFDNGVNWTLGLPFVRTSPDHGTAYDIAGRGVALPGSMLSAIRLAKQLAGANR